VTREEKITEARKLRGEGLSYQAVADALGVAGSTVQKWLKPEWAKKSNAKRGPAKRAWEANQRADCPNCGAPMQIGSKMPSHASERCAECVRDEGRSRTIRYIAMRKEGLLNTEIAEREGVRVVVVAAVLSRADRYGLTVPRSPYFRQVAA
jgi:transposase